VAYRCEQSLSRCITNDVTRGDICLQAQHFGDANLWPECCLVIKTNYQMSANASSNDLQNVEASGRKQLRNLEITKVRKANRYEP